MSVAGDAIGAGTAPPSTHTVVRASDVVLAHGDHVAVEHTTFELGTGVLVAVIGPNGSGKSSLLDAIAGLLPLRSGTLEVLGRAPGMQRARVAYVLQSTEVPAHLPMTVREVVTLGRYASSGLLGRIAGTGREAVTRAMARTGVTDLAERHLLELSGGQRQRVLVAQGLASAADLLLLDEPMTGLDVVSRDRIAGVMAEERAAGRTVVFSTHDLQEAAGADVVLLLAGGVVACGPPADVLTEGHLTRAYRGRVLRAEDGSLTVLDDPHHHGDRADRHDGHSH
jgi:iron complex transport system ATP-binding protein